MAFNYDEFYRETPDALGEPTPIFVSFFKGWNARILNLRCGQSLTGD